MNQYIGGGKIETLVWTPTRRLIQQTQYISNHTEITTTTWTRRKP